jgi:pyruvate dehydrogenase E2 component (dihydrolipoamide acetyltransferase)
VTDLILPELGENITAGDVLRVLVQAGDTLAKDQPVLELETDKATIEVPSSLAGQVKEIKVKAGDKVKVGQVILSVEEGDRKRPSSGNPSAEAAPAKTAPAATAPAETAPAETVLAETAPAGTGPAKTGPAKTTPAETAPTETAPAENAEATDEGAIDPRVEGKRASATDRAGAVADGQRAEGDRTPQRGRAGASGAEKVVDFSRGARPSAESPAEPEQPPAPAAPSVRRMARELGVDINDVSGSGAGGRISAEDVKAHVNRLVSAAMAPGGAAAAVLPDFSRWGEIERQPMRAVRRKTAEHLLAAWTTIPHVTQHDLADVTSLEELRQRFAKRAEAAGGNLTVTSIAVKVVASALKAFPQFNVSVDMGAEEIIQKKYVHIGVAVDTDRGLLVPVIRDADTKNIIQLSVELAQLSEKARQRKLSLDEMQGGCFSISNLGGIGGTAFSPIVNTPEVAILGISRTRLEPVYRGTELVPRLMLPLSLSYDHRVVDGADGIRFLRWIVEALEQPFLLSLQG